MSKFKLVLNIVANKKDTYLENAEERIRLGEKFIVRDISSLKTIKHTSCVFSEEGVTYIMVKSGEIVLIYIDYLDGWYKFTKCSDVNIPDESVKYFTVVKEEKYKNAQVRLGYNNKN